MAARAKGRARTVPARRRAAARPPAARWRRRKAARPSEILAAALDSFAERGYAATRLEDVAKRAGVTKGTLYLYFPNKEELFKAVVRDALVPLLSRIAASGAAPGPVAAQLGGLLSQIEPVVRSPVGAIPKLVFAEAGNFPELARFYLREVVERGLAGIKSVLDRGVAAREFRAIDTAHAAYCVVAPMLLALLWTHSFAPVAKRPLDVDALWRVHLDLLLDGLRRPVAAP